MQASKLRSTSDASHVHFPNISGFRVSPSRRDFIDNVGEVDVGVKRVGLSKSEGAKSGFHGFCSPKAKTSLDWIKLILEGK